MSPERDDFQDDDERDEFASRSIFSAGWFRAVLVLTVLAIGVVISLPYLLNWFEPSPPPRAPASAQSPKPAPSAAPPTTVGLSPPPPPAVPIAAAPEVRPPAPVTPPAPKAAAAPPAPAPKAVAAVPSPSSEPVRKAAPDKPPPKAAAEKPAAKAPAEKAPAKAPVERTPTVERTSANAAEKAPARTTDTPPAPARVVARVDAPSRPAPTADAKPSAATGAGSYWIQLGAFKEQKNADSLARALRDAGFPVQVTPLGKAGAGESKATTQQHELFVTGTSADKVNAALKGRGTAQPVSGGVAVKPAFSLQDAMTVSKRLTDEGLKVVIRPASGLTIPSPTPPEGTLHAVRAGGYPNRATALAARDELAAKGHRGFLAEGPAR